MSRYPIKCPYCGCKSKDGYDLVDHCEEDDDNIRDVYHCPKCRQDAVRHYEFEGWEEPDGTPIEVVSP